MFAQRLFRSPPLASTVLPVLVSLTIAGMLGGCTPGEAKDGGLGPPAGDVVAIVLSAHSIAVQPAQTYTFNASGRLSDGSMVGVPTTWEASGGTISSAGSYTAGRTPGRYQVIATLQDGTQADTSIVVILDSTVTLLQLVLTPATFTLAPGATGQFTVAASWSDGSSGTPPVTYTAAGGTISTSGLYTAGIAAGAFQVMATYKESVTVTSAVTIASDTGSQPLWTADMETGNLQQWEDNLYQNVPCGGQVDTGPDALTVPSTDFARSGHWSAKMAIGGNSTATSTNGTRMYRWCEPQRNPELFYSVWYYIPQKLTVSNSGWMNLFQFNSKRAGTASADPFFFLDLRNAPSTGAMRFMLTWWGGLQIEGPTPGLSGYRTWNSPLDLPVGRWFHVQARYVCSPDFTGSIQVWQDGVEIFNLAGVRTRYEVAECQWSVNTYGTGISPSPVVVYIDDAAISRTKIGE